jgi:heat shock protein HslJ
MASATMACAEGADTERAFTTALERTRSWRLIGENLDFFDEAGDLLARFEARDME